MSLEELWEEIKDLDVSEPACMDIVLSYLEKLSEEDDDYMEMLKERLSGESISWEIPWYQDTRCLTRPLKEPAGDQVEKYEKNSMTSEEIRLIHKNWRKFRKTYDVPNKPICLARWRNRSMNTLLPEEHVRRFVIAYLARGLKRNLYQVYRHFVTHYGAPVKGDYSDKEKKIMDICFYHKPNNACTILSTVLSREPRGIYKRLELSINGKPVRKRLKWTLPLATKLVKLLMEYTDLPLKKLKYKKIEKPVWLKLESEIDQHYIPIQKFWHTYLHVQLFVKKRVSLKRLRKNIYKKFKSSSYKVWRDIRWKELLEQFPEGFTHLFLYRVAHGGIYRCPNYLKIPLEDVADYGLANLKKHCSRHRRCLRNLRLNENGELEEIKYLEKIKYF